MGMRTRTRVMKSTVAMAVAVMAALVIGLVHARPASAGVGNREVILRATGSLTDKVEGRSCPVISYAGDLTDGNGKIGSLSIRQRCSHAYLKLTVTAQVGSDGDLFVTYDAKLYQLVGVGPGTVTIPGVDLAGKEVAHRYFAMWVENHKERSVRNWNVGNSSVNASVNGSVEFP
jgi:hypothetical protein